MIAARTLGLSELKIINITDVALIITVASDPTFNSSSF